MTMTKGRWVIETLRRLGVAEHEEPVICRPPRAVGPGEAVPEVTSSGSVIQLWPLRRRRIEAGADIALREGVGVEPHAFLLRDISVTAPPPSLAKLRCLISTPQSGGAVDWSSAAGSNVAVSAVR